MRKKAWLRATRHLFASGRVDTGAENTKDQVMRLSWLQMSFFRGSTTRWNTTPSDTRGGQDGDHCRQPALENILPNPDANKEENMALVCSSTTCESVREPDRLYELMALAKRKGATIVCLQGTLFDGVSESATHGYHFLSLNRSGPRQKDGCTIAISTKFARTHIRCVHHWMPGWILGLLLQCGQGRRAGDVYVISAYAPVHDERTQPVACDPLRLELWRKLNGDIRQIPNMCRVILCMDANGEVYSTLPWIGNAGNRVRDRRQRGTQNGHELLELLRSYQLVAILTHGEASPVLDLVLTVRDPATLGLHDHTPNGCRPR